ncbi:MAG: putative glycine dehydrogenase (decarboxylating) subunit 1 [marine bacterium B5-7]|nr:MAG: putative glycine dehydrogenase (decarboxylating) subunit 1 [marine bacterium B5-7]
MPFIPHTEDDVNTMLSAIGVDSIEQLFEEIPAALRCDDLKEIPDGLSEMAISQQMFQRARQDANNLCFLGAGAYEHFIPAAVWDVTSRGEFMTAYTPYQAEASQGTLQLIYEYQTMMARLTGMDVSNASMYDGASALIEAILMAVRSNRRNKSDHVIIPGSLHPLYRQVIDTLCPNFTFEVLPFDETTGQIDINTLPSTEFSVLVIAQPNFFGGLEQVDALTDWAHANNALVVGAVNPTSLALLKPPGEWGEQGADIACGEGQPLGVPLASGGPYFGLLTAKKALVRQMPGRIVGRTHDQNEKIGYTLTLQAREQHIRRAKATSNICTNQGLLVTAATIYMSLMGDEGLSAVASASHANTKQLVASLCELDGVSQRFDTPFFHEAVLQFEQPVPAILEKLADYHIQGGVWLGEYFPALENCLLVCATETKTPEMLAQYKMALKDCL